MRRNTRRPHSPQGQYIAGKRQGKVYTQAQYGVVPDKTADEVDLEFPNEPISHRRPLNPRTQDSLDLDDFEKITITKQPRGLLPPQEHNSNGVRETTASQHPREDSHRLLRGELQMARAINAKELMLQEKLRRVEEIIRQKIQRNGATAADDDQMNEEEKQDRGRAERRKAQINTTLPQLQRREAVRGREMMTQERRQEDIKQLRKRQDQMNEDRMRNTHEEARARWKRRETEIVQSPQSQTHEFTVHGQEMSREPDKLRWKNVKEHTRSGGDEKDNGNWGETGVKEREQNATSMGDKGWTREKKYAERTREKMNGSDAERDRPQKSQQKTSHRAATENHRAAGRKLSGEPPLSPDSSPSHPSRSEDGELRHIASTYDGPQLLLCRICNRKFTSERLETHVQICKKLKQSHRQVFNSFVNRTKGSALEEYLKTHSRSKTPEVLKKKKRR